MEILMKIRGGFVSNSSSTAFIITNNAKFTRDLVDLINSNPKILEDFNSCYDWHNVTEEKLVESAAENNQVFAPGESRRCEFGDEDGTPVGLVFDYGLRNTRPNPVSEWDWKFAESLR
jgi:hypothetical protein